MAWLWRWDLLVLTILVSGCLLTNPLDQQDDDGVSVEDEKPTEEQDGLTEEKKEIAKSGVSSSVRDLFRSPISSPVTLLVSVALGMLMSIYLYESPLSPLPVPPLPSSPIGLFPPTQKAVPFLPHALHRSLDTDNFQQYIQPFLNTKHQPSTARHVQGISQALRNVVELISLATDDSFQTTTSDHQSNNTSCPLGQSCTELR